MFIIVTQEQDDARAILHCPCCTSEYTHHENISIGSRIEDEDGIRTRINLDGKVTIQREQAHAFRGRRSEVLIEFWCEQCPFGGRLILLQHKGQSFLSWERDDSINRHAKEKLYNEHMQSCRTDDEDIK
jgi:hypothetical protein